MVYRGIILFKAHQSHHLLFRFVCLSSSCSWSGSGSSPPAPCYRVSLWPFTYSRGRGHHSSRVQDLQRSHPGAQWEQNIQSESLPGAAGSSKQVKRVSYLLLSLFLIDIIIYVNPVLAADVKKICPLFFFFVIIAVISCTYQLLGMNITDFNDSLICLLMSFCVCMCWLQIEMNPFY